MLIDCIWGEWVLKEVIVYKIYLVFELQIKFQIAFISATIVLRQMMISGYILLSYL